MSSIADQIENTLASYDNAFCAVILLTIRAKKLARSLTTTIGIWRSPLTSDMILAVAGWQR